MLKLALLLHGQIIVITYVFNAVNLLIIVKNVVMKQFVLNANQIIIFMNKLV